MRRILCTSILSLFALAPLAAQDAPDSSRAEALVRQGQFDEAIAILQPLLASKPRNLKALNLLGIALTQKGDLPAANREFSRALQLDPKFYPALENLAANEFALKDYAASEKHFLEALEFAPDDPAVNSFLGKITFKRNEYARAEEYLRKSKSLFSQEPALAVALVQSELETGRDASALKILPQISAQSTPLRAQFQLALALATHSHYAEAIHYFEYVQKQYTDSYDASFNLAVCYVETKQFTRAIDLLLALKTRSHTTAELDNLLAESYHGTGQLQPEIDALREATQLDPQDEDNYLDLATLCIDHDGFDLALEVLNVGLHHRPQSDRLVFQRGIAHAMKNEFDLADKDFQLASQLAPDKNLSYVGLGVSYMQTGNVAEAIRTLRERIKEKPADATLQYLLGKALIRSGASRGDAEFVDARTAIETSVKLSPAFVPSLVELAKMHLLEDHVDQAVPLLERARSLDPKDNAAWSQLAIAYRRQGKPEKAKEALAALAKLNAEQRLKATTGRIRLVKQDPAPAP
jgi:Flp pilus assembly protein TadD